MKKSNVILQAAVASALLAMFGSANAASSLTATAVSYATEQFAGMTPYAAVVAPTMTVVAATAIPSGSIITVQVELTGGHFAVSQAGALFGAAGANKADALVGAVTPTCTMGSTTAGVTTAAAGVVAPTATTSNANVVSCTWTTDTAVALGGNVLRITTPSISASALSSTANSVTAAATILIGTQTAPVGTAVSTTGTLEAVSAAKTIATAAKGITLSAAAHTSTAKIDLTAATPSTKFSTTTASATETGSTTKIKLGSVTVVDGTAKVVATGNGAYNTGAKTTAVTLTAPAGFFAPLGTSGVIELVTVGGNACSGAVVGTSATYGTKALAAAATTVTLPAAALTGAVSPGTDWDICMTVDGVTAIATGTPSVTATLGASANQDSTDTLAATNLLALSQNGQTSYVRNYIPAAVTGFTEIVRVSNTGSVAAPVTVTMYSESGAQIGTPYTTASLAAGATTRLSQATIEAGVGGTLASTDRPRLKITAPTNGLDVQSLMFSNGVYTNLSGTE